MRFDLYLDDDKVFSSDDMKEILGFMGNCVSDCDGRVASGLGGYFRYSFLADEGCVQVDFGSCDSFFYIRKSDGSDIGFEDMEFDDYVAPL